VRPDTLQAYLRAVPFRAFRIVLNSGRAYEVRHPEMIRVGRDSFVFYHADSPEAPYDRFDTVGLLLVERIEHLETVVPATPPTAG
jgi:hypothetical protein